MWFAQFTPCHALDPLDHQRCGWSSFSYLVRFQKHGNLPYRRNCSFRRSIPTFPHICCYLLGQLDVDQKLDSLITKRDSVMDMYGHSLKLTTLEPESMTKEKITLMVNERYESTALEEVILMYKVSK